MNALVGLAAGSAALAVLLLRPPPGKTARHRLAGLTDPGRGVGRYGLGRPRLGPPRGRRVRWGAAGLVATALFLVVGGWLGVLLAIGAAVAVARALARLQPGEQRRRDERLRRDLPAGLDLLAACLQAGTPTAVALDAVGAAMGGPLEAVWRAVASAVRLGADLDAVRPGGAQPPAEVVEACRAVLRATRTGAAVAETVSRISAEQRAAGRAAGEAAVRRTAVFVLLPLGLCFLPAFVLVGVVPVVTAVARAALP